MFDRYYQDELAYLRELGKEFAKAHPALAPMLAGPGSDPDVERLLEGVAFLTSKLRLKLDDELPEIVHSLLEILWPHFLRPIPSTTIVEFNPKSSLQEKLNIPAGTYLDSVAIEDIPCHFRTCYPVDLQPLKIENVGFEERATTRSVLKIDFSLINLDLATYEFESIGLFLHGDLAMMTCLYLLFCHHLKKIRLSVPGSKDYVELTPDMLEPLGFGKDDAIFPYPEHAFAGYRLLLEYFLFPQKFLFLRVKGFSRLGDFSGNEFTCEFIFDRDYVYATQLTPENIRLHCTPAVNLFDHEADPIRVDHERVEYLVRPTGPDRRFFDIYSIDKVVGWLPGTAEEKRYWPLFS
ncbi:MAG TPA: type VI secretion system baseplate subunit TssF, partial [Deltaproteobacteria bacterium]|nr:type VI secretion system baseplate subunit TssF [Deltaproteobacteria bacterium]